MVLGIGDTVSVTNTVGGEDALGVMGQYAQNRMQYEEELAAETLVYTALAIAQMIAYWILANDQINNRDRVIGKYAEDDDGMLGFLWKLEKYRDEQDYPILLKKAAVKDGITRDLKSFEPDSCGDAVRYVEELEGDAASIDSMENMFAACSCSGIPQGWGIHDGSLALGLGASFAGPIMNIASVDIYNKFKYDAIELVQEAQSAMKTIYNISGVMAYYGQAINIFQGLADLFISGFNSAGAMLGTALGRMANSGSKGNVINTSELGISGTGTSALGIGYAYTSQGG